MKTKIALKFPKKNFFISAENWPGAERVKVWSSRTNVKI